MDREAALVTSLRDLAGWRLLVSCDHCRECREVMIAELARQDRPLSEVIGRLRCGKCWTRPTWIKLADGRIGAAREVTEIMVLEWGDGLASK